jgi:hypothetical protein
MNSNPDGPKHIDELFKQAVSVNKFYWMKNLYFIEF